MWSISTIEIDAGISSRELKTWESRKEAYLEHGAWDAEQEVIRKVEVGQLLEAFELTGDVVHSSLGTRDVEHLPKQEFAFNKRKSIDETTDIW